MNARLPGLICCGLFACATLCAAEIVPLTVTVAEEALTVKRGDDRVLEYVFAQRLFKPYVRELYSPHRVNVLLDGPADHLHHHGLMYAIRVNGINFWEETGKPGHEVPVALLSHKAGLGAVGIPFATFIQRIHWLSHTNIGAANSRDLALLVETRTITVTLDRDEVAVDWTGEFQVGTKPVQVHGSGYNGLGLRPIRSFDRLAKRQNSNGASYTAAANWDVTPGRWSLLSGEARGNETTIVMFSSPRNAGEPRFFSMLNPFAYLAATQNLEQQPVAYRPGDRFTVRHLVAVYSGSRAPDFLNQRYARWVKEVGASQTQKPLP